MQIIEFTQNRLKHLETLKNIAYNAGDLTAYTRYEQEIENVKRTLNTLKGLVS